MSNFECENYLANDEPNSNSMAESESSVVIKHKTNKPIRQRLLLQSYGLSLVPIFFVLIPIYIITKVSDFPFSYVLLLVAIVIALGTVFIIKIPRFNPDFDCALTINGEGFTISKMVGETIESKPLIYPGFDKPLMEWTKFCYYRATPVNREIFVVKFLRYPDICHDLAMICESDYSTVTIALGEDETNELIEAIGSKLPFYDLDSQGLVLFVEDTEESLGEIGSTEVAQTRENLQKESEDRPRPRVSRGPVDTSHSRHLRRGESINLSSYVSSTNYRSSNRSHRSSNSESNNQIDNLEHY